jgi:hypothetical protein
MGRTWKATTGGILEIIAGSTALCIGSLVLSLRGTLASLNWGKLSGNWMWREHGMGKLYILRVLQEAGLLHTALLIAGIVCLVLGAITLAGGIHAIKRRRWGLALAGSILAVPTSGPLGVLAIIFISLGKKEFKE